MHKASNILVIDDEAIVCESFMNILAPEGYSVDTFSNPLDGLEMAESRHYDLVFLDLKMEPVSGMEVLHRLRESEPLLPVVIVTGYPSMDTAIESIQLNVSDYLLKPFTPDEILKLTRRIIPEVSPLMEEAGLKLAMPALLEEWQPAMEPMLFYEYAWMETGKDGTVRIGGQIPHYIAERINAVTLPEIHDETFRGLPLAGFVTGEDLKFVLPSPVSGKIVDVNYEVTENTKLLLENDPGKNWIARILPCDPENEKSKLQKREVLVFSKSKAAGQKYQRRLKELGCVVHRAYTLSQVIEQLAYSKEMLVLVDGESFEGFGPGYVRTINEEAPDAKVVVYGPSDLADEAEYHLHKIMYYGLEPEFEDEAVDVIACTFTTIASDETYTLHESGILPQSVSRIKIINKEGNKVTLLSFGELIRNDRGIGYHLIHQLQEGAFPIEITRSTIRSTPSDIAGRQKILKELESCELLIILQSKDMNKIPGQVEKRIVRTVRKDGLIGKYISVDVQPAGVIDYLKSGFNVSTSKGVANLLFNEMTAG